MQDTRTVRKLSTCRVLALSESCLPAGYSQCQKVVYLQGTRTVRKLSTCRVLALSEISLPAGYGTRTVRNFSTCRILALSESCLPGDSRTAAPPCDSSWWASGRRSSPARTQRVWPPSLPPGVPGQQLPTNNQLIKPLASGYLNTRRKQPKVWTNSQAQVSQAQLNRVGTGVPVQLPVSL